MRTASPCLDIYRLEDGIQYNGTMPRSGPSAVATKIEFVHANSQESFEAEPPTIFTSRERKVVANWAEDFLMTYAANVEILVQALNKLSSCSCKRGTKFARGRMHASRESVQ